MPIAEISAGTVLILVVLAALPVGAVAFALGAGRAFSQIGRGELSIGEESQGGAGGGPAGSGSGGAAAGDGASAAEREQEVRQMLQARRDRALARGERGFDVEAEAERLLADTPVAGDDRALREEVRQLVVARNERRSRRGERPLDVEAEVERRLRELEGLGQ